MERLAGQKQTLPNRRVTGLGANKRLQLGEHIAHGELEPSPPRERLRVTRYVLSDLRMHDRGCLDASECGKPLYDAGGDEKV